MLSMALLHDAANERGTNTLLQFRTFECAIIVVYNLYKAAKTIIHSKSDFSLTAL